MNEKLIQLYNECIEKLKSIGIDTLSEKIGNIAIKLPNRKNS